jgi:DUF1680 family protein
LLPTIGSLAADYSPKVQPLVPFKAEPFGFDEVKLLGGPLKHAEELNAKFLLSLDVDRLVARFRQEAGLPKVAEAYPGWETVQLPGVGCGFYLSGCSMLLASTGDAEFGKRIDRVLDLLEECQKANGDGYLLATKNGKRIFGEIEKGDLRLTEGWKFNGEPEPYYAMEKLLSGLRDAYRIAGRRKALEIETKLCLWLEHHMAAIPDELMQRLMSYEYGGMNWVLSDLYVDTGDKRFLEMSARWWDKAIYDPLGRGEDILPGKHANTQFPKICGLVASYSYTAKPVELKAAEFFWDRVVNSQTYVTGGNSMNEHFGPAGKLDNRLAGNTTESCNSYNMLRLTRMLFCVDPRPDEAEFYERALFNHILAHQNPVDGRVCYYLQLDGGRNKAFDTAYTSFSCCVCSAMESHARHASFIYMRDGEGLFVNLFAPSELNWKARGVTVKQETKFPEEETAKLMFTCERPTTFTLKLRHPVWSQEMTATVNGQAVETGKAGEYAFIRRDWKTGDRVDVKLTMTLRTEAMPDNPQRIGFFKGPILLAGDLGPESQRRPARAELPLVIAKKDAPLESWLEAVPNHPLEFRTKGILSGPDVALRPFYQMYDNRYLVYWERGTEQEVARRKEVAALQVKWKSAVEARTVDSVNVADNASEQAHGLVATNSNTGRNEPTGMRWRDAQGSFSYNLKVKPDRPMELICTWWGSDEGRLFDISVDGMRIAVVHHDRLFPEQAFTMTYPIPVELTAGKEKITVNFSARPGNTAGGLLDVLRIAEVK